MNYILFDDSRRESLLPLTYMRPVADIRFGILTIREKWEKYLGQKTSSLTEDYLTIKYPLIKEDVNILINGSVIPDKKLVKAIKALKSHQALIYEDCIIAMHLTADDIDNVEDVDTEEVQYDECHMCLINTWDIFSKNDEAIRSDFELVKGRRKSKKLNDSNTLIGEDNIFVEEGAVVNGAIINASTGPVYIGRNAEIMEGSVIRGPLALCEHGVIKMAAKIYGPVTVGPYTKVGGEVNCSVLFGYSNKAHDGFLGHSVIAEWCNLGADTNVSNLNNTYLPVKLWNYAEESFIETGLQFCGVIMGDYSKTGINTMINTGTVIGINANIYGSGYQRNFINSFLTGGTTGFRILNLKKIMDVAARVYYRRGREFDDTEQELLRRVYNLSFAYRRNY